MVSYVLLVGSVQTIADMMRDEDKTMTTLLDPPTNFEPNGVAAHGIATGDVLEFDLDGEAVTALVLLAADQAVILDKCDDSTPFVLKADELIGYRKFDPVA